MVARVGSALFLLGYAAIIFFFLVFLDEAVEKAQHRLRVGTWTALFGSIAAAVIVGLNLLVLFNRPVVSSHQLGVVSSIASMLIPVASVLFFAGFLADAASASARLLRAARLALVGAILSAGAHGVAAVAFGLTPGIPGDMNVILIGLGAPIVLFAVGTWLYFLSLLRNPGIDTV